MTTARLHAVIVLALFSFASDVYGGEQTPEPVRAITNVRGDLYRVQDGEQFTVFLVTPDGIVLGDPLNTAAARWLRQELDRRYPGRPVRYVVRTHHHFERAAGAGVFDRTAELVGHEQFNRALEQAMDVPGVVYQDLVDVESTYGDRRRLVLGGKTVELVHTGPAHAVDMTALYFHEERIVFAVDIPAVTSSPFSFGSSRPQDVAAWLHAVTPLDFDTLLSGHGETVSRADLVALRAYVDDLMSGVLAGYERGLSVNEIQATSILKAGMPVHLAQRNAHIEQVYDSLRLRDVNVYGVALFNYAQPNPWYCTSSTSCDEPSSVVAAGTAGMRFTRDALGAVGELRIGGRLKASSTSQLYDYELVHRETLVSFLFRYSPLQRAPVTFGVVAGPTVVVGRTSGAEVWKWVVPESARRRPYTRRTAEFAVTVGGDVVLSLGNRVDAIVPVRFTRALSKPPSAFMGDHDFHVGVGLSMRVSRRIH